VVLTFHVNLREQAIKPGRHPPVAGTEKFHGGWDQDHSNDGGVEKYGHSHTEAKELQLAVISKDEGAENTDHD
jgi:hypothetical protein